MIDLRKRAITAVKIIPKDSRADDFHTAVAEYLYKELKYQGLNVKKQNVTLKISLDKICKDKYDQIVIDCLAGKLYLRGKEVKDKFFGKLRRFEGSCPSEAYHCVVQSATRIANRIKRLMNDLLDENDEREIYGEEIDRLDLRKRRIDLRKNRLMAKDMRKKVVAYGEYTETPSYTDLDERQKAICYIDGNIYEGGVHAGIINKYLEDNGFGGLSNSWSRPNLEEDWRKDVELIKQSIKELAFAHLINEGEIRLETDSFYNVSESTVATALKSKYPGAFIYDDNRYDEIRDKYRKIAKDMRRSAYSDIVDRFKALLYADGEILEGYTHATCLNNYLEQHNLGTIQERQFRPAIRVKNPDIGTDEYIIQQNIKQIGFAHYINEGEIRVETDTLYNLDLNTFISTLKAKYPGAVIYDDGQIDPISGEHKKIAKYLIKKSELIDAFRKRDSYVEVFRDPSNNEIEAVKDSYYNGFKGAIGKNGILYVWGIDVAHDDINDYSKVNIDISNITLYGEGSELYVSGNRSVNIEELVEYINNYSNLFTNKYQYNLYGFNNLKDFDIESNKFYSLDEILEKIV